MSENQPNQIGRPPNTGPLPDPGTQPTQAYPLGGNYPTYGPPTQPGGYYPPAAQGYYPPPPQGQPPYAPYSAYPPYQPAYYPPSPPAKPRSIIAPVLIALIVGLLLGGLAIGGFVLLRGNGTTNAIAVTQPSPTANPIAPVTSQATATMIVEPPPTATPAAGEEQPSATPQISETAPPDTPSASDSSGSDLNKPYPQPKELTPGDKPSPTPQPVISRPLSPSEVAIEQQAMGDAFKDDVKKLDDPSEYRIVASISLAERKIDASEALTYTNNTSVPQSTLYLRTWANSPQYAGGGTKISAVKVNGAVGNFDDAAEHGTVLAIKLPQPLGAEQTVRLDINFSDTVPLNGGGYGMYNYKDGVMALAAWYPLMAVYDDRGWKLDPPGNQGDQDFSEVSLYDVTLTLANGAQAATSGSPFGDAAQSSDGGSTQRYVSGPMREFTMVVSDKFKLANADADGVKVNSWYLAADEKYGQNVATWTANAIKTYSKLYGAYPYKEIDSVEVPLGNGAGGVEFPGLVFLDSHLYSDNAASGVTGGLSLGMGEDRVLEFTTAHEIGHQWWYGMVGSNPQRYAFLDEGLVQYTSALYFEKVYGQSDFKQQFDLWCILPYQVQVTMMGGDDLLDQPTAHWNGDGMGYGAIVYGKGPLFFHVLRQTLGDDAFFKTMQTYLQTYKYGLATPERFIAVAEQVSGEDLSGLYNRWLLEKHGSEDIAKYSIDLSNGLGGGLSP